ncbi:FAD-dependent oxidoreductase [Enhygromyxa salina]|nr:FAD-dependent oxidoreductase [Enhygromyxa salina]
MTSRSPIRVAIIGGGCAAMTTAFELSRPEHRGRFEVTVYQMGFRLGGKGASGRGVADRIEEHGLHLWMGFYDNAFALMRECYAELNRDPQRCPIATWRQAFEPAPDVAVVDRSPRGEWAPWVAHFPPGRGLPGDPPTSRAPFSVRGYLVQAAKLVVELLRSAKLHPPGAVAQPPESRALLDAAGVIEAVTRLLRLGVLGAPTGLLEGVELLSRALQTLGPLPLPGETVLWPLLEQISAASRRNLSRLVDDQPDLQRVWQVIDLVLTIIRGIMAHNLAADPRGFDAINDYDWIEWLRSHGAAEQSLRSGFVRGIYDLVFAYQDGDTSRPRLAAGVALRGSLRMFFTYRGALFWRMNAGMGDVVFAPLYEVCKRRGVRFEFFHRLREVGVVESARRQLPHVASLVFDLQAKLHAPEYQPLVNVRGLPCWPAQADYDQLEAGPRLRDEGWKFESAHESRVAGQRTLELGRDFDMVVLGIGVAAIPLCGKQLLDHSPRWRRMCEHGETAATQAFQLWMNEDMAQLGWPHPQINLSGFVEPFDTWADMRHLIPREGWQQDVRSIAYFVSVLPDTASAGAASDQVRRNAIDFLNLDIGALWPNAIAAPGQFRWEVLACEGHDPNREPEGEARFDTQFWLANVNPTDRYSLSVPGSIHHRISPLDLDFDNLTVAGDWTATGLDSGCVESAVMSGLLAAHALSQSPPLEAIVGYDHP